ncbi:ribosome silencing factor [Alcanivorax sp. JB21]|uniref:ribosome silencing factor n=2 Tax=Alcanivorax limicola TaxID=2874102 RepID=UPI001CBDA793|nr:ribosome silencing factor [Alcanivorax limicola]MBZ2189992.1 ribosome silencing factor [Alcanivorax limicola]
MTASTPDLLDTIINALEELKARNVSSLDVREFTSIADNMVIATGTSSRHVKALADNVAEQAKAAGYPPVGMEGQQNSEWVLVDLGDVIVHVMLPATREYYDLERLWRQPDLHPDRAPKAANDSDGSTDTPRGE